MNNTIKLLLVAAILIVLGYKLPAYGWQMDNQPLCGAGKTIEVVNSSAVCK